MAIRVVKLGSDRHPNEGLRIGTVRRPPRGVPKSDTASRNFYDLWFPILSPSPQAIAATKNDSSVAGWNRFAKKYQAEMKQPACRATLELLAALSHHTNFSVGCYCADESRCHRSILRKLLQTRGAHLL